ncbi:MAG TPA: hypothetical protein VFQ34_12125 [Nitrospiraceae bacterium]|nr:hypothetical protein [Nitrospiraceae bacterium]
MALLESLGFDLYVVVGDDDFHEMLKHGGKSIRDDYAYFYPDALLEVLPFQNMSKHSYGSFRQAGTRQLFLSYARKQTDR